MGTQIIFPCPALVTRRKISFIILYRAQNLPSLLQKLSKSMIRGFQRKKEIKENCLSGLFSHSFKRMRRYGVAAVDLKLLAQGK